MGVAGQAVAYDRPRLPWSRGRHEPSRSGTSARLNAATAQIPLWSTLYVKPDATNTGVRKGLSPFWKYKIEFIGFGGTRICDAGRTCLAFSSCIFINVPRLIISHFHNCTVLPLCPSPSMLQPRLCSGSSMLWHGKVEFIQPMVCNIVHYYRFSAKWLLLTSSSLMNSSLDVAIQRRSKSVTGFGCEDVASKHSE